MDKAGKTVDFYLGRTRDVNVAKAILRGAMKNTRRPTKITLDANAASHRAVREIKEGGELPRRVAVRSRQYLNNLIEQDHRRVKRRISPMLGFKRFANAAVVVGGIELAEKIKKDQFKTGELGRATATAPEIWRAALAQNTSPSNERSDLRVAPRQICTRAIAEACNIGLEPLVHNDVQALRRARLSWVDQNLIRNETLVEANAGLVAEQNKTLLVQHWRGGEGASTDGLRCVVLVRTLHAGPHPKYFGFERGVTYYNLVSDQFTGLNAIVIPGTLRDSLYIRAMVFGQQTALHPTETELTPTLYSGCSGCWATVFVLADRRCRWHAVLANRSVG